MGVHLSRGSEAGGLWPHRMQPLLVLVDYYLWTGVKVAYFSSILLGSWVVVAADFIKVPPLLASRI